MGQEGQAMDARVKNKKVDSASRIELRELIEKQNYRCALSGVSLTPSDAQLDHIVPVSDGGTHLIDNLQVVHSVINRMKGTLSNEEFRHWCKMVTQEMKNHKTPPTDNGSLTLF
jgi:5-methylcytosine-specific restriction endonuclease McrA